MSQQNAEEFPDEGLDGDGLAKDEEEK